MKKLFILVFIVLITPNIYAQYPKLTFSPHWLPQAQFAGYYVALEKGFYQQEGIDVTITHPSASVMATDKLIAQQSDIISLFLITALAEKSKGLDLVNIGQLGQNSALLFVSKKESNINSLNDLQGKKIGIWESGFDEVPKSIIKTNQLQVNWIPILSTPNLFLIGGIDVMTVMWYNEYDQIINAGINTDELNTLFFSDYGYNIPEDGIYCLNQTLIQRKSDLKKFMKATIRGWEYAKKNKEETLDIVLQIMTQAHAPTNKAHQSWMLDKVIELMESKTENTISGKLNESDFNAATQCLIDNNRLFQTIEFNDFYKPVIE